MVNGARFATTALTSSMPESFADSWAMTMREGVISTLVAVDPFTSMMSAGMSSVSSTVVPKVLVSIIAPFRRCRC